MRPFAAFVFVATACCAAFACSSAKNSSFDDAGAEQTGSFEDPGGGSISQPTGLPGETCLAKTKNLAACEKCCEVDEQKVGYDVFKQAINACACQPTLCGGVCVADICASPPLVPPPNSECATCLGTLTSGQTLPPGNTYGGGSSPNLGVTNCRAYGADVCKKSGDCQATELCKESCRERARDAGTL